MENTNGKCILNEQHPLIDLIPVGIIFLNQDRRILHMNKFAQDKLYRKAKEVTNRHWNDVFPYLLTTEIESDAPEISQCTFADQSFIAQKSPFYNKHDLSGFVLILQCTSNIEEVTKELDSYKNLILDLKGIFDISYDVIYVSDGDGVTLRVSSACERLWGYKESELVGKTVYQLEQKGVFNPSVTRLVLERKEKVSLFQTTKTGRRLMVVGTPIKDEQGQIIRVVNASRDITEVNQLQSELDTLKKITEGYRQEIMELRVKDELEKKIVFRSEKMEKVINFSKKIAKVDSTVLLLGESGVGKELIASFIHKWSNRNDAPFVTINCGAMPEKLLEEELFGYEEASLAVKGGQMGVIEMVNGGTLFFDEVEEMPLTIQAKLLRVMQEKSLLRISGTKPVQVNVRIIAASNRDLQEMITEGSFRKDLYYKLNVVPIIIPPLSERNEDIIPLILHFTEQLNKKYMEDRKFHPLLLKKLQEYSWPGNVRELQNIIERLYVTSDNPWIRVEHLPEYMKESNEKQKSIQVNKIMPLKEAVELLEKELLEIAGKQYGSTTKIAEVLGVNQSTISRKMQRYKKTL